MCGRGARRRPNADVCRFFLIRRANLLVQHEQKLTNFGAELSLKLTPNPLRPLPYWPPHVAAPSCAAPSQMCPQMWWLSHVAATYALLSPHTLPRKCRACSLLLTSLFRQAPRSDERKLLSAEAGRAYLAAAEASVAAPRLPKCRDWHRSGAAFAVADEYAPAAVSFEAALS